MWLLLCIAMATPLREFLRDVGLRPVLKFGSLVHEPGQGEVRRVTLVLPDGTATLNGAEEASICDALTCFLALVWGKPSGARIAVRRGFWDRDETTWRLPCAMDGS
jgi:hypothetical protein